MVPYDSFEYKPLGKGPRRREERSEWRKIEKKLSEVNMRAVS